MVKKKIDDKGEALSVKPMIVLPQIVLTPLIAQPVKIEDEIQREWLSKFTGTNSEIFFATASLNPDKKGEKILENGLLCAIDKILEMPGAPSLAFVRPLSRAKFNKQIYHPEYPMADISLLKEITSPKRLPAEGAAMMERIAELFNGLMQFMGDPEKATAEKVVADNSFSVVNKLYAMTHIAPISWEDKYKILKCSTFNMLLKTVALTLDEAEQKITLQARIHEKTHKEMSMQQKEVFLRQHLRQVKEELGETEEDEASELIAKAATKKWPKEAREFFDKEIQKLRRLNINNPEYSVQHSYLEAFTQLPWENYKKSDISLDKVEKILNRDHYGLDKVKERIMEYMAVTKLRNDLKAPIICLYGPPGVGKTSIGKSVAEAVGREYARISLGGMHDEAEIRGHRRTYIGAMPGRFLHTLSKLKHGNPLILLDEIDKVGKDFKGDPSSALLEALDPEQNNTFHDNFIDFPYDLSKVLFIATANDVSTIPPALRDRMEIIEMPAYTQDEKREIALRHLVAQALDENGFGKKEITFTPEAIDVIVKKFTHESGVRQLKMQIAKILRKLALLKVRKKDYPKVIRPETVTGLLDKKDLTHTRLGFRG